MKFHHHLFSIAALLLLPLTAQAAPGSNAALQQRCGWFVNPTPANAWLIDNAGQWIVGTQGGQQADGDWPTFKAGQWVKTNGPYGYGCACLKLSADAQTRKVSRIVSARTLPLQQCKNDRALKAPG